MNGQFLIDESGRLAATASDAKAMPVLTDAKMIDAAAKASAPVPNEPGDLARRVAVVWERAYSRAPSQAELTMAVGFVRDHLKSTGPVAPGLKADQPAHRVLTALGHLSQALMASNEFLYVD